MKSKAIFGLSAFAVVALGLASSSAANATQYEVDGKVTICHATSSNQNSNNPYTTNTVSINGVGNKGIGDHFDKHKGEAGLVIDSYEAHQTAKAAKQNWGDIIPPTDVHPEGLNWTEKGQAVWESGCGYAQDSVNFCDPSELTRGSIADWLAKNGINGADCFEYVVEKQCGLLDVRLTKYPHFEGKPYTVVYTTDGTVKLPAGSFPAKFAEDENEGTVNVTWYIVGPEKDYLVGTDLPNFWDGNGETVEIRTNCEGGSGGGGTTPTPETPVTPTTPETPKTSETPESPIVLPFTSGVATPIVAVGALSLLGAVLAAGSAIKSRILA